MIESKKQRLVLLEWKNFYNVNNEGGRASCQENMETFIIMRKCQITLWSEELIDSWYDDLIEAENEGRNLFAEKYAWMMSKTAPEQFEKLKRFLHEPTDEMKEKIEEIIQFEMKGMEEYRKKYPYLAMGNRNFYSGQDSTDDTSFETYLRGELYTYSLKTLNLYLDMVRQLEKSNQNMALAVMESMVKAYGYESLEQAEKHYKIRAKNNI